MAIARNSPRYEESIMTRVAALLLSLVLPSLAMADATIDPMLKYAWSENTG